MYKIFYKISCVFVIALLVSNSIKAQETGISSNATFNDKLFNGIGEYRTWSIGVNAGVLLPMSVFGGNNDFSNWESNFGYGLNVKKQFSHIWGLEADFIGGTISANNNRLLNNASPSSPFQSFKTDIHWTASLNLVATLANISWSNAKTYVKPYASLGLGSINYTPHLVNSDGTNYNPSGNQSNFYVPVGMGVKVHLSQILNLDAGYTIGFVDGDYLDGYYKAPYLSDKFSYAHLGLEFVIGDKSKPQLARYNPARQATRHLNETDIALRHEIMTLSDRLEDRTKQLNSLNDDVARMKKDSDGDGVNDYFDKCPNTPKGTRVDGSGCPLPQITQPTENKVELSDNVSRVISQGDLYVMNDASQNLEFESGKSTLKKVSYPYLHRVADVLMRKGLQIKLNGYTDNIGSDVANLKLSKARAESVKHYLMENGVHEDRIETEGLGNAAPIASNKTAAGRKKNRRVEFTVY